MKTIEQLYNGFYLDNECLNAQISGCQTPLWVAPIKKSNNFENLRIEKDKFAFAERDENWEIEFFHGLNNFLWIEKPDFSPIFVFDNHNHAPVFWYDIIYDKWFKGINLIHIDQHSDCWENENILELNLGEKELEKVFHFYNEKCNVGNFIPPSLESWIISNQIQVRSTTALKNLEVGKNQNFILDIDLDFCLDWINRDKINQKSVKILKEKFDKFWQFALCTTIATSPYFLDQELAISLVDNLLDDHWLI